MILNLLQAHLEEKREDLGVILLWKQSGIPEVEGDISGAARVTILSEKTKEHYVTKRNGWVAVIECYSEFTLEAIRERVHSFDGISQVTGRCHWSVSQGITYALYTRTSKENLQRPIVTQVLIARKIQDIYGGNVAPPVCKSLSDMGRHSRRENEQRGSASHEIEAVH